MYKYMIFGIRCEWNIIYCDTGATTEEIAKAISSQIFVKKFDKDDVICEFGTGITDDSSMYILHDPKLDMNFIWQIGSQAVDMEMRLIPHAYYVRRIGVVSREVGR